MDAWGVTGKTPHGVRWALVLCTPSSAKTADAQGVGAFAAIERDDRTAVSERVPHRLPGDRGNRTRRTVQARSAAFHTPRTEGSALPPSTGTLAHVTANRREPVHMLPQLVRRGAVPVRKAIHGPVHMLPRTHLTVMFPLPLRTLRTVVYRAVREWS